MEKLDFINDLDAKCLSVDEFKAAVLSQMESEFEKQSDANKIERIGRQTLILCSDSKKKSENHSSKSLDIESSRRCLYPSKSFITEDLHYLIIPKIFWKL